MGLTSTLASMALPFIPAPVRRAAAAAADAAAGAAVRATDSDRVPDFAIRAGIRALLAQRDAMVGGGEGGEGGAKRSRPPRHALTSRHPSLLSPQSHVGVEEAARVTQAFVDELDASPVAVQTAAANEQHYEVPTPYFEAVLGARMKYSCCLYPDPSTTLDEAEEAMLATAAARARLADGQAVLELGCGWGSLCLYIAEKYPGSSVTAVSNSRTQKAHIDATARARGLTNLTVLTADAATFIPPASTFDRVVSVEMFEHMKNYRALMTRIEYSLKPGGRLFVHVFVHRSMPYHFESAGPTDWMATHFFSGGTMPSADLLPRCAPAGLALAGQWAVNGTHYARTLEDWLKKHDAAKGAVAAVMADTYGAADAARWAQRWRIFYMACSELFAYKGGDTWYVAHYAWDKDGGGEKAVGAA